MSKQRIDKLIPEAYQAIEKCNLSNKGKVDKMLRSQISAFGAAVTMGSLLSAVAFFSKKGGAQSDRQLLMKAIHWLISPRENRESVTETSLLDMLVKAHNPNIYRESIIDAAIAIKLAMNLFDLTKNKKDSETEGA